MTDRELMQQALDALEHLYPRAVREFDGEKVQSAVEALRTRLAQPEPKDDGYCQACDGTDCTAKTGCVAISNPEWEPLVDRQYSPDGVLLSEKIKYTPDGGWQDLKQKSVAWLSPGGDVSRSKDYFEEMGFTNLMPLYTAPPQREWQGLTLDECNACLVEADPCEALAEPEAWELMRTIEAKLKEKNT